MTVVADPGLSAKLNLLARQIRMRADAFRNFGQFAPIATETPERQLALQGRQDRPGMHPGSWQLIKQGIKHDFEILVHEMDRLEAEAMRHRA